MGEIFNEENEQSFFVFLEKYAFKNSEWAKPSHRVKSFLAYIEYCRGKIADWKPSAKVILLDVKYSQLHLIYGAWQGFEKSPLLYDIIKSQKWRILHLIRNDVLASVLSNLIAQATKIYHRELDQVIGYERGMIQVDIREAYLECDASVKQANDIKNQFGGSKRYFEASYEDLWASTGNFDDHFLRSAEDFFALQSQISHVPKLKKVINGNVLEMVINRDEVEYRLGSFRCTGL